MTTLAEERRRGSRARTGASALAGELAADLKKRVEAPTTEMLATEIHRRTRRAWKVYVVLGVALLAYVVSIFVRGTNQQWTWLDGWSVVGFEAVACAVGEWLAVILPRLGA